MSEDRVRGWSLAARLRLPMALATLVAGGAVLGVGLWAQNATGVGDATSTSMQPTVLAVTLAATVVVVAVTVGAWLWMRGMVRDRVLGLAEVCDQVQAGERGLRAVAAGDDEFAALVASLNALLAGEAGPAGDVQDAAALQAQIEKLLQEVSAVGDGDLRVQAEVTPDTLGVLADSFNYMIEELAKVVGRVQATTLQVTNATRRLLDRSAEVAQASEVQAQHLTVTSEAVGQLTNFVQMSARSAQTATEAAQEALRNARGGQQAVVQTIDGMVHIRENVQETAKSIKRLGERSQEVGEIVRLIEDIADQTNLLALNAAIQSAMAGEHGRGFAVVADEIRVLAERSAEATKKIATIVKSIQGDTYEAVVAMEDSTQQVVAGSRLADEAGQALQSIYSAVERQARIIEAIARAALERAQTADEVSAAMSRISEITRQTNAATQDAASSVSYLAELAEQLRASVAAFRLPEQGADQSGLLLPNQGAFPPMDDLPNLPPPAWASPGVAALPALPPADGPDYGGYYGPADPVFPGYGAPPNGDPAYPGYGAPPNGDPVFPGYGAPPNGDLGQMDFPSAYPGASYPSDSLSVPPLPGEPF